MNQHETSKSGEKNRLSRRAFVASLAAAGPAAIGSYHYYREHYEAGLRASVFVGQAASYSVDLTDILTRAIRAIGAEARIVGRNALIKPNLVEPHEGIGHINTHPVFIGAVTSTLLRLGASTVIVGEGPGHCRDTLLVIEEAGLLEVLRQDRIRFVDLNSESVYALPNTGGRSSLGPLLLPACLQNVDLIVSVPKMKTHHWAGVTLSMKNLFGLMPGLVYGWPKNVLHQVGINNSIFDINATVRPHLAIVDGIMGMEGDGPIMGKPKHAGAIVVGENLPAVDATCARIMEIDPAKVPHLSSAAGYLGPIREKHIEQRGEGISRVQTPFGLLEKIEAHRGIRLQT